MNHRPAASKIRHFFNKQRAKARGRKPGADRRPCRVGEGEDRSLYSHISIPPFLAHCKDFLLNFPQIPHGEEKRRSRAGAARNSGEKREGPGDPSGGGDVQYGEKDGGQHIARFDFFPAQKWHNVEG